MAQWSEFVAAVPEFATAVTQSFESGKHKTLATLRADGSPRVSGIEAYLIGDDLWFGSMPGALKGRDLLRDPRFALHGPPALLAAETSGAAGDVKLAGRAIRVTDRERIGAMLVARGFAADAFPESLFFTADLDEVVLTRMSDAGMVIDLWQPGQPVRHLPRS